jgi:hypothetical protein
VLAENSRRVADVKPNAESGVHLDTKEQSNCGIESTDARDEGLIREG